MHPMQQRQTSMDYSRWNISMLRGNNINAWASTLHNFFVANCDQNKLTIITKTRKHLKFCSRRIGAVVESVSCTMGPGFAPWQGLQKIICMCFQMTVIHNCSGMYESVVSLSASKGDYERQGLQRNTVLNDGKWLGWVCHRANHKN